MRREVDSAAVELKYGTQKLLTALGCVNPDNPKQLNVAGLVMFGKANAIRRLCPRAREDYVDRFADCSLNDGQRTALVFLREVGALDALAYRQLTGCPAKRVARDLAGLKAQGLMIQKGRARGAYYVPSEMLLMTTPLPANTIPPSVTGTPLPVTGTPLPVTGTPLPVTGTPLSVIGTPLPVTGTPLSVIGTPLPVTGTPRGETTTPPGVITTPQGANTTPRGETTTPRGGNALARGGNAPACGENAPAPSIGKHLPIALEERIGKLGRHVKADMLQDVIVELCKIRPMSKNDLVQILGRKERTIKKLVTPLLGNALDYLYPMMPHHPRQAYVARVGVESESGK